VAIYILVGSTAIGAAIAPPGMKVYEYLGVLKEVAIVDDPPTDVALVRYREYRPLRSILVPVTGGLNSRRMVRMAVHIAQAGDHAPGKVPLLHVLPVGAASADRVRAEQPLRYALEGIDYERVEQRIVEDTDVVETILARRRARI
jgi:hypothetical protein